MSSDASIGPDSSLKRVMVEGVFTFIGEKIILLAIFTILLAKIYFYWRKNVFIGEKRNLLANWKFCVIFSIFQNKEAAQKRSTLSGYSFFSII
jgi:hypothetical protein